VYSSRISSAIEKIHDAIALELEDADDERRQSLMPVVMQHLPDALKPFADRITTNVPWPYVVNIIAARLASHLVYSEGLAFTENCHESTLARVAFNYVEQEARVRELTATVRDSSIPNATEIADLLESGGVRAALKV